MFQDILRFLQSYNYLVIFLKYEFIFNLLVGIRTCFTQGGINKFHLPQNATCMEKSILEPRKGYYGWFGFGGSVMQWHPDLKIGFGYVPTLLHWYDVQGKRGADLQKLAVECAEKNQQS